MMTPPLRTACFASFFCATLVASGCVIDKKLGDPADEGDTDASGDGASSESGSGDSVGGGSAGGGSATGGSGTTADAADTDSAGDSAGPGNDDRSLCETACQAQCPEIAPFEECMVECEAQVAEYAGSPMCLATFASVVECMVASECNEASCIGPLTTLEEQCSCSVGAGGAGDGGVCFVEWECYGDARSIDCEGETCTCTADGEVTGTCDAGDVCLELLDEQVTADFALTCCGWDDYPGIES